MTTQSTLGLVRAIAALGDHTTMRALTAISNGAHTFSELRRASGLSDSVLADRLAHLRAHEFVFQRAYERNPVRWTYHASPIADDLFAARLGLWRWDTLWKLYPAAPSFGVRHAGCNKSVTPTVGCAGCSGIGLTPHDVHIEVSPLLHNELATASGLRRVRSSAAAEMGAEQILGDSWSVALIAATLAGASSFAEFKSALGGISTATLSDRLQRFVSIGMLTQVQGGQGRRQPYLPTLSFLSFCPVIGALGDWSRHFTDEPGITFTHVNCEQRMGIQYTCNSCNEVMDARTTVFDSRASAGGGSADLHQR